MIQREPWLQRDRAMIDQLRSLGIEKGKPFQPDARIQALLDAGAAAAQVWLEQQYSPGFAPFYPGSHWGPPAVPVFVEPCKAPTLFAHLKRCDLHGLSEGDARAPQDVPRCASETATRNFSWRS